MAVIIVPFLSLGYVTGPFTVFSGFGSGPTTAFADNTAAGLIDGISFWNCQHNGYLAGGPWSFLGIDLHVGRMSFAQAKTLDMVWN